MNLPTIYATHANVALSTEAALISFLSPGGPVQDGSITASESARLVITFNTLRKFAALLSQKVADLDALEVARAAESHAGQVTREIERRSVDCEETHPSHKAHRLQ